MNGKYFSLQSQQKPTLLNSTAKSRTGKVAREETLTGCREGRKTKQPAEAGRAREHTAGRTLTHSPRPHTPRVPFMVAMCLPHTGSTHTPGTPIMVAMCPPHSPHTHQELPSLWSCAPHTVHTHTRNSHHGGHAPRNTVSTHTGTPS